MARDQFDAGTLEMFGTSREPVVKTQTAQGNAVLFPTTNREFLEQTQWVGEQFKSYLGTAVSGAGPEVVLYVTLKLIMESMRDDKKMSFGSAMYYLTTTLRGVFPDSGLDAA